MERRKRFSGVDNLEPAETLNDCRFSDVHYGYDVELAKEKKSSDALKKLRASVEDASHQVKLFCTNVSTFDDLFRSDLHEGFAAFLSQKRDPIKELVKKRDFGAKKIVYVNVSIVAEMLQALESEFSNLRQHLISVG